jgi:hypothetical protein
VRRGAPSAPDASAPDRPLEEYGGLASIPDDELKVTLKWLVLCYVGEPGGYGAGLNRRVFCSNSAAPLVEPLREEGSDAAREPLAKLADDREVKRALRASDSVARVTRTCLTSSKSKPAGCRRRGRAQVLRMQ